MVAVVGLVVLVLLVVVVVVDTSGTWNVVTTRALSITEGAAANPSLTTIASASAVLVVAFAVVPAAWEE